MSNEQLIEDYRLSVSQKNRAKLAITGLVLTTVAVFTFLAWSSLNGFFVLAVPEISNLLAARMSDNADNYLSSINGTASKVIPVYSKEFQRVLKQDWSLIENAGEAELVALNKYSQNKWPEIEKQLSKIASDQNDVIRIELEKALGKDKGQKIAESYTLAALSNYNKFIQSHFSQHAATGHTVGVNLRKIVEKEPDVSSDVDIHQAFGLALEVVGLELQELGKK